MDPAEIRRGLRTLRWFRRTAWLCAGVPVVLTTILVVVNKVFPGSTHFLVSGASWTHRFWSWMFNIFALGCALCLLTLARRCPRCRGPFHHRGLTRLQARNQPGIGFNTNIFSRRCLSCGLRVDGSNIEEPS